MTLLFFILGFIGVTFAYIGNRHAEMTGKILMLIGAFALIFVILAVVFSGLCFMNTLDMQKATDDYYDENDADDPPKIFLGYNYLPLIFGIILLIMTAIYMAKVFPKTMRSLRAYPPGYYPQYAAPPPQERRDYSQPPPPGPAPAPREPPRYDQPPPQQQQRPEPPSYNPPPREQPRYDHYEDRPRY